MTTPTTATPFDYGPLDGDTRRYVEARTGEIRALVRRSAGDIIEIGGKLIEVKGRLDHGQFGRWLAGEFGWGERTAQNFMRVAGRFKTANFADLSVAPSALYLLAAPSVPEAAAREALEAAAAGETVTYTMAREIAGRHKAAAEEPERFVCGDCGELFAGTVWHCPYCDGHWRPSQPSCPACGHDRATARQVAAVRELRDEAPALFGRVLNGGLSVTAARREMATRGTAAARPLPAGKYGVIYADPPWRYEEHGVTVAPAYGGTGWHYPSMTIEELCALPVGDLAAANCALFIWVTSPKLDQVWPVLAAWGFDYKTSFVWDKVRHNFGHYNSVRHELLLVAGRGSSTPEVTTLFDSVQTIERSAVHSEKPEEFRKIIEMLYPLARKIELFARRRAAGWDIWGNQIDEAAG